MDRNAELTQPAHVMSYHSISLALIQRGQPTLRIWFAGAEYLEDKWRVVLQLPNAPG